MKVFGVYDDGNKRTDLGWMDGLQPGEKTTITLPSGAKLDVVAEEISTKPFAKIPFISDKQIQSIASFFARYSPDSADQIKNIADEAAFLQENGKVHVQIFRAEPLNKKETLKEAIERVKHLLEDQPPEKLSNTLIEEIIKKLEDASKEK